MNNSKVSLNFELDTANPAQMEAASIFFKLLGAAAKVPSDIKVVPFPGGGATVSGTPIETKEEPVVPTKKTRKRRTKAQIEADKKAAEDAKALEEAHEARKATEAKLAAEKAAAEKKEEEEPVDDLLGEEVEIALDDVKKRIREIVVADKAKRPKIKAKLVELGAENSTTLDKKHYPAFMQFLDKV